MVLKRYEISLHLCFPEFLANTLYRVEGSTSWKYEPACNGVLQLNPITVILAKVNASYF